MSDTNKVQKDTGMKQFEKRIEKLEKKLADIKAKVSALDEEKKKINAEISHIKDEQILYIVKSSNLTLDQIAESIQLAYSLQQAGYNQDDVSGMSKTDIEELTADMTYTMDFNTEE